MGCRDNHPATPPPPGARIDLSIAPELATAAFRVKHDVRALKIKTGVPSIIDDVVRKFQPVSSNLYHQIGSMDCGRVDCIQIKPVSEPYFDGIVVDAGGHLIVEEGFDRFLRESSTEIEM